MNHHLTDLTSHRTSNDSSLTQRDDLHLCCHQVSHWYAQTMALSHISVSYIGPGCIALIGANGAGKSTLLRGIVGAQTLSSGFISLGNLELYPESPARVNLGYLSEQPDLPLELSVEEMIWGATILRGLSKEEGKHALEWVLKRCQLDELSSRRCVTLSRGQRQRVRLASALVHRPKLLVLDEVHSGLDPLQTSELNQLLGELSQTCLVLMSTHRLHAAAEIADTYWVLHDGVLIAQGPLDSWSHEANPHQTLEKAYHQLIKEQEVRKNSDI